MNGSDSTTDLEQPEVLHITLPRGTTPREAIRTFAPFIITCFKRGDE